MVRRGSGVVVLSPMPCCVSVRWTGGVVRMLLSCPPCLAVSVLGGLVGWSGLAVSVLGGLLGWSGLAVSVFGGVVRNCASIEVFV